MDKLQQIVMLWKQWLGKKYIYCYCKCIVLILFCTFDDPIFPQPTLTRINKKKLQKEKWKKMSWRDSIYIYISSSPYFVLLEEIGSKGFFLFRHASLAFTLKLYFWLWKFSKENWKRNMNEIKINVWQIFSRVHV